MQTRLLALAALFASAAAPALASTLVDNVVGVQVDAAGNIQRFNAVLIGDDGKVERLYAPGEARTARPDFRLDGRGRVMLPGLIDAHGHVVDSPGGGSGLGLFLMDLDLTGTTSIADLQDRLKRFAEANPAQRWLTGRGWNQENWAERRMPTSADLDAVVSDRPVWLMRVDGHAAIGNSMALKEAGITPKTKAPQGGRIEGGLFTDAAIGLVDAKIPPIQPIIRDRALLKAQQVLLANGLTTVTDMGTSQADWDTFRRLGDDGRLNMRVISYAIDLPTLLSVAGTRPTPWLYGGKLRMAGVKIYADGALGSRGAWLKAPYADAPETRGLMLVDDTEMKNQASRAAMDGFQVAIHAIGDAANAGVIAAFEELGATYKGDRRWRIEHVQVLDPKDISRLAPAGIIASMQPTHQISDRTMAEARLGPDRLGGAYAWQTLARSGARLAFGSDFPVEAPNPFPGLAAAVSRQDAAGQPAGGWRPEERLTIGQALAGFTRGAAHAGFAEERIGSLDPGRYADFIFVDRDPTTVSAAELRETKVLETWVGGKMVYRAEGVSAAPTPPAPTVKATPPAR